MKKLKVFILSFAAILFAAIIFVKCNVKTDELMSDSELKLENRSVDCFVPGINCLVENVTETLILPDVHCGFITYVVRYDVWNCPDGTITFDDLRADPVYICPSLDNYFISLTDNQLSEYFDSIFYEISLNVEFNYMKDHLSQLAICPYEYKSSQFFTNLCYQWCVELVGKPRPGDPIMYSINRVICGEHCCIRSRSFCWNNGVLQASAPSFQSSGSTNCASIPLDECDRGRLVGQCNDHVCGAP